MNAVLSMIDIQSIYELHGSKVLLPKRMALCTPDTKAALLGLVDDVQQKGGVLQLSDLFRSYDMQLQAHLDYVTKKKKAFSPAPGASMHESGRAFDVDIEALKMPLADFWGLAKKRGVVPIISKPDKSASEAWHFECRGSHELVRADYEQRKDINFNPSAAMAASAILGAGVKVDFFKGKENEARIQSALIRLGHVIGNIDGAVGPKTRKALEKLKLANAPLDEVLSILSQLLEKKYPQEFFDKAQSDFSVAHIG